MTPSAVTEPMIIGPRTPVITTEPDRPGNGTSRRWSRTINGRPYSFTAVTMPNGERRYFVSRYNGYLSDVNGLPTPGATKWGCAWSPAHEWIIPAASRNHWLRERFITGAGEVRAHAFTFTPTADPHAGITPTFHPALTPAGDWTCPRERCGWSTANMIPGTDAGTKIRIAARHIARRDATGRCQDQALGSIRIAIYEMAIRYGNARAEYSRALWLRQYPANDDRTGRAERNCHRRLLAIDRLAAKLGS